MNIVLTRKFWLKVGIVICLFNVAVIPPASAVANVYDEQFYLNNDILFYDPNDGSCTTGALSNTAASLTGNTNAERIWNWLKAQGLSNEQTAGVMGNIQQESGFNPTRHENKKAWSDGGWGLAQWTNYPIGGPTGRRLAIATSLSGQPDLAPYYDAKYGGAATDGSGRNPGVPEDINIKLLDFELNYMMQESQGRPVSKKVANQGFGTANASEWDTLKQQKTTNDALIFWHNNFEVSGDSAEEVITNRGGFAQSAFNSFSGVATETGTGSAANPVTNCADSTTDSFNFNGGNLSETIKAYAWPDYKKGYTQKMPAYQAAIEKAKSERRYVGNNGIDCGGFITTLMVDSGFDPAYNHSGKIASGAGPTGTQRAWLDANWDNIGNGKAINPANLKPGDVAMLPGHTFMYAGTIDGFNSVIASASNGVRAPMAGQESPTASNVTWYRKKG